MPVVNAFWSLFLGPHALATPTTTFSLPGILPSPCRLPSIFSLALNQVQSLNKLLRAASLSSVPSQWLQHGASPLPTPASGSDGRYDSAELVPL